MKVLDSKFLVLLNNSIFFFKVPTLFIANLFKIYKTEKKIMIRR